MFRGGVFCRPTLTLSVDKFRYSALCYHLVIIDLLKTATVVAKLFQIICYVYSSIFFTLGHLFGQNSRKGTFFFETCIDIKEVLETALGTIGVPFKFYDV